MALEDDDIELKDELEVFRHKELVSSINKLTNAISESNSKILDSLNKSIDFSSVVSEIKKIKPEVNIDSNQDQVISAINKMSSDIKSLIESKISSGFESVVTELSREKTFVLNKNSNGFIESITVK